jgi:predicted transposase YdaD
VQLILAPENQAPDLAKQLVVQVERETTAPQRDEVVEFIETVLVYKFPQLSRR